MNFLLPQLPYTYGALEPHIDSRTMEFHHRRHHGAYVAKLNKALEGRELDYSNIDELVASVDTLPEEI